MSIDFTCDDCGKGAGLDENHYCFVCYSGLEAQIEDLENKIGDLLVEIDDLKKEAL